MDRMWTESQGSIRYTAKEGYAGSVTYEIVFINGTEDMQIARDYAPRVKSDPEILRRNVEGAIAFIDRVETEHKELNKPKVVG